MKPLKHILTFLFIFYLILEAYSVFNPLDKNTLHDGDLIFQTTVNSQSTAIMMASKSLYTHVGIVKHYGNQIVVIEATGPVKETPLNDWINHGALSRISVMRDTRMTTKQAQHLFKQAKTYYGQPYDPHFRFNNGKLYCSELPYILHQQAGIPIGQTHTVTELNSHNPIVEHLMKTRWQTDPICNGLSSFRACQPKMLSQQLITPAGLMNDRNLTHVYSNYPFILKTLAGLIQQ